MDPNRNSTPLDRPQNRKHSPTPTNSALAEAFRRLSVRTARTPERSGSLETARSVQEELNAARQRLPSQYDLIPYLDWREATPNIDMTDGQVLNGDNRRVGIIWNNLSSDNVRVRPVLPASATEGVLLVAQDTPFKMLFSEYGVILGQAWFGQADGAGSDLFILEIIYNPPR